MVFYTINKKSFPIIKIVFSGKVNDNELDDFLNEWLGFYDLKKKFYLFFDITNIENPSIKSAYKLVKFIQKIKMKNPQYLKKSIIILNEGFLLKNLIHIIFKITKPAAPLYLYWKHEYEINITNDTIQEVFESNNDKFQVILP
jgi:hypothetical protein